MDLNYYVQLITENFDFSYVLVVNILAYVIIKAIDELNLDKSVPTWQKRIILFISMVLIIEFTEQKLIIMI